MTYNNLKIIQLCCDYAAIAHKGQWRKDKKTPFFSHPSRVANYIASCDMPLEMICAAFLHDVVEDCRKDMRGSRFSILNHSRMLDDFLLENEEIPYLVGKKIIKLVLDLTRFEIKGLSKTEYTRKYYEDLADRTKTDEESCLIKFADRIDNLLTFQVFTPKGRVGYLSDTNMLVGYIGERVSSQSPLIYDKFMRTVKYANEVNDSLKE